MQNATSPMMFHARGKSLRRWAVALGTGLFTVVIVAKQLPSGIADPRIAKAVDGVAQVGAGHPLSPIGKLEDPVSVQLTDGANARNNAAVPADPFAATESSSQAPGWSDLFGSRDKSRDHQQPRSRRRQVAVGDNSVTPVVDGVEDARANSLVAQGAPATSPAGPAATAPAPTTEPASQGPAVAPKAFVGFDLSPSDKFVVSSEDTSPASSQKSYRESSFMEDPIEDTVEATTQDTMAGPMEDTMAGPATSPAESAELASESSEVVTSITPSTTPATTPSDTPATTPATTPSTTPATTAATTAAAEPRGGLGSVPLTGDARTVRAASSGNASPQPKAKLPVFSVVVSGLDDNGDVHLMTNRSTAIRTKRPIKTINVAAPDVADVLTLSPDMVLVTAKKPGSTQIMLWDESGAQASMDVYVSFDIGQIKEIVKTVVPGAEIEVAAANGSIVLKGEVPDVATAEKLLTLVKPYGQVVNFLEVAGGQQILLEVQFAEVSRSVVRQLGVNLASQDGISFLGSNIGNSGLFGINAIGDTDIGLGVPDQVRNATLFGSVRSGNSGIAFLITALKDNNLLRVLARPNLVAMSGKKGTFLAGGEIPIPQPSQDGLGIVYKEYGIRLNYSPVALGNGNISMEIEAEVSEVDPSVSVQIGGGPVPGFTTRKSATVAELADGQTMAIAGMLSSSVAANRQAIPGLGELPIIGALFRSTRYQQRETELLILITPRLVKGMNPEEVPAVPGEQWRDPNDVELYFGTGMGQDATPRPTRPAPAYRREHTQAPAVPEEPRPYFEPANIEHRTEHVPYTTQNPGSKVADRPSDASTVSPEMTELDSGLVAPQ